MAADPDARRLVAPSPDLRRALVDMAADWRRAGDVRYAEVLDDFPGWVRFVEERSRQESCPEGIVAQDHLFLVDGDGTVLGGCRLRHRLSPRLRVEGGHIGYDVRPSRRREGHATRILELALRRAADRGIDRVLVTCDADNVASARVIGKNGGVEAKPSVSERSGKTVRRFWIAR